ncbi:MAG: hypothetical protein WBY94_25055 [Polyangiaceae bacterium]
MVRRPLSIIGALMAVALHPVASARADKPCAHVVAPSGLSPEWAAAVENLRKQIAELSAAECQPLTISIEAQEVGMRIVATASDGRRTSRTIKGPDVLSPVAIGLLITIPSEPTAAPAATPPPASAAAPPPSPPPLARSPTAASTTAHPADARTAERVAPHAIESSGRTIALWAGISGGIRLTAPTALSVLDVEARADLLIDPWLMLIAVRSALIACLGQQGVDCDVYNDVSIGVGVGRRFHVGAPDIDVAFEPSLVVMHMEYDGDSSGEGKTVVDTDTALRLDVSARLSIPFDPSWALTLTLDGGLAPSLLARPANIQLPVAGGTDAQTIPAFPAWSGGLRLGVSGALL